MPDKLDRCVADVKAQGGVDNPYAVCNASIGESDGNVINRLLATEGVIAKIIDSWKESGKPPIDWQSRLNETFAIPGSLSGVKIGGRKKTEEMVRELEYVIS